MLVALIRHPRFATSRTFVAWNVLGMLDLVVAVSMGLLNSGLAAGVAGEITTRPMSRLPLVLVAAYLVPMFALLQARRLGSHVSERGEPSRINAYGDKLPTGWPGRGPAGRAAEPAALQQGRRLK